MKTLSFYLIFILALKVFVVDSRTLGLDALVSFFSHNGPAEGAETNEDLPENFERTEIIGDKFKATWRVDFSKKNITFDVEVETKGYVGFGISEDGSMDGADLIIGGVWENGTTYFEDRFSKGHAPGIDAHADWKLIQATETTTSTLLKFYRAFDTGDAEDNIINDEDTNFIWAIGSTDDVRRHANRGSFSVNILQPKLDVTTTPEPIQEENFVRSKRFNADYQVTWEVRFDTSQVIFDIEARTKGYVGFGISNTGTMDQADLIIGGVHDDRTPYFSDRHSSGHSTAEDISQDWQILEIRETETSTFMRVIRSLDTGDLDDLPLTENRTNFIWAIGSSDDIAKHAERGFYALYPLQPSVPEPFVRVEKINENYTVSWECDFENEIIIFEVLAQTKGYVGFGLSKDGKMEGMDLVLGGILEDGTPYFGDYYCAVRHTVTRDAEQNWWLLGAREQGNSTYLKFVRNFDTGDELYDSIVNDEDIFITWALGASDDIKRHATRGNIPANILKAPEVRASFERKVELSSDFQLTYHVNFLMRRITFDAEVSTTGYIGFGIAPSGTMYNADLIIGGVDSQGISYFDDRFSTRHGVPVVDKYQDWFLESATENNQGTHLTFYRNLFTMDSLEDYEILDENTFLIWAVGSSDDMRRHAVRGNYAINLFQTQDTVTSTLAPTTETPEDFQRTEILTKGFSASWELFFANSTIIFELEVQTKGYIGFGFSKEGSMNNADLLFGGVKNDVPYIEDRVSNGHAPTLDEQQDWKIISAVEVGEVTTLRVSRLLDTRDTEDIPIKNENTYFIWAIGSSDDIQYHDGNRGNFKVNILDSLQSGRTISPDPPTSAPAAALSLTSVATLTIFSLIFALKFLL